MGDGVCGMHTIQPALSLPIAQTPRTHHQPPLVWHVGREIHMVDDKGVGERAGIGPFAVGGVERATVILLLEAVCVVCLDGGKELIVEPFLHTPYTCVHIDLRT